jgi:hypothetical protein
MLQVEVSLSDPHAKGKTVLLFGYLWSHLFIWFKLSVILSAIPFPIHTQYAIMPINMHIPITISTVSMLSYMLLDCDKIV